MNPRSVALAALCAAAFALPAQAQFEQFKGKMKPGLYEYKMEMDLGNMAPPGMGKQAHTFQHCVTEQDIDKGQVGRGGRDGKMPENCQVKDFKMSGNTATYRMECTGQGAMTMDNKITFREGGYVMDAVMSMNQGGQPIKMNHHMEGKYLGACKK